MRILETDICTPTFLSIIHNSQDRKQLKGPMADDLDKEMVHAHTVEWNQVRVKRRKLYHLQKQECTEDMKLLELGQSQKEKHGTSYPSHLK